MEQPQRIANRIPAYDYSQDGAYFVTICSEGRKPIFSTIVGDGSPVPKACGKIAEALIQRISEKYPMVQIDKYVIMPDHIHILFRIRNGTGHPSPAMGNVIGWYKYQTSKEINSTIGTPGQQIFQRSYYDHVIRNQQDYNEIWEYIDNNPRKWMMKMRGME